MIYNCQLEALSSGLWKYDDQQNYSRQSGSGNNWAYGYQCHGPTACKEAFNLIRKEVEKCDHLTGFLSLQSVAGGT